MGRSKMKESEWWIEEVIERLQRGEKIYLGTFYPKPKKISWWKRKREQNVPRI
jgi:hypothetical protein